MPRRLLAILTARLGGEVMIDQSEISGTPQETSITFDRPHGTVRQWRIRVSGLPLGLPIDVLARMPVQREIPNPPVDLEAKAFPPTFRTCPECKFSFELVHGDECPVCKLMEYESTGGQSVREMREQLEAVKVEAANWKESARASDARAISLKRSIDSEKETTRAVDLKCQKMNMELNAANLEVARLRRELLEVASGKKVIQTKPKAGVEKEVISHVTNAQGVAGEAMETMKDALSERETPIRFSSSDPVQRRGIRAFFEPILRSMNGSIGHHDMKEFIPGVERHVFAFDIPRPYRLPTISVDHSIDDPFGDQPEVEF